jgi:hypothetical protein
LCRNKIDLKAPEPAKKDNPKSNEASNKVHEIASKIESLEKTANKLIESFNANHQLEDFFNKIKSLRYVQRTFPFSGLFLVNFVSNKRSRKQISDLCQEAFLVHIETSSNLNIDSNHWRSCYHHLIEKLRKEYTNSFDEIIKTKLGEYLSSVLNEGVEFYSNFVDSIEKKFLKFRASHYVDINYYDRCLQVFINNSESNLNLITTIQSKEMKYALTLINRCWISLGDLERYREIIPLRNEDSQATKTSSDYSISRSYYLKAIALAPKSSRAYHQLAILAMYTKRHLEACYYYFRCLEVTNPLTTVRQSLNAIFEEARFKLESINKTRMQLSAKKKNKKSTKNIKLDEKHSKNQNRIEVWFKPVSRKDTQAGKVNEIVNQDDLSQESDLDDIMTTSFSSDDGENENVSQKKNSNRLLFMKEKNLNTSELNKRFMLNYLNAIGRLFTKVSMETFNEVSASTLKSFDELLHRRPCPLGTRNYIFLITAIL